MYRKLAVLLVIVILLGVTGALAQPVRNADSQFSINLHALGDGEQSNVSVDVVQLLGIDEDGSYLIYADGLFFKAAADGLSGLLRYVDTSGLRSIDEFEPLAKGARGEKVIELQKALIKLGYLFGVADGDYGNQSMNAVMAFQRDVGLEQTGEADAMLQMLAISMASDEFVIDSSMDPKARFAAIADKVQVNMEPIYDSGMNLEYDAFEGTGFISDGVGIEYDASGAADIDQAVFTLKYGFAVREQNSGASTVTPVLNVSCLCARRPVMQNLLLKVGDQRVTLPVGELKNTLAGVRSEESCSIALDDQTLNLLLSAGDGLQLRIEAKYQSFDIVVPEENLAGVAEFARIALAL